MLNLLSLPMSYRWCLASLLSLCVIEGAFAQDYKTRFDADEALLEKLVQRRRGAWVNFQLETIRKRYPGKREDLAYLNATYLPSAPQRIEALKKINEGSPRFGEAQLALSREFRKPEERVDFLRKAYQSLKGNKDKPEKALMAQRALISVLVDIGTKKSIDEALKIIKETTGGDKRYMQFQSARLQLILADKIMDEAGKLSLDQKTMVEGVIKALVQGDIFWQNDYIAMLGYCEMAHAYILLNKPLEAYKQLRSPFKSMVDMTKLFPREMRIHSPEIPAKYYLAKASVQRYRRVKAGTEKPPKVPVTEGNKRKLVQLSQQKGMEYFLVKAFNIYQYELQEKYINKSRLSKLALLEADKLRTIMRQEGLNPPPPKESQLQRIAWEKAVEAYSDQKYEEAIPHFETAGKTNGQYRGEKALDSLFYLTVCYARVDKFDDAISRAKTATLNFKKNERAWDAIYLVGTEALKASSAVRGKDEEKYAQYRKIASDMFNYIVEKNKSYSKAEGAIYQQGNDMWSEAIEVGKLKTEAQKRLDAQRGKASGAELQRLVKERDEALEKMKKAYLEAAKPYKLLLDNYSSSKYCTKAIHRLAWIHLIVQDKPQAIKYFTLFCERDKTPTADYIDSKYWMANSYYSDDERDKAIKLFDEVITLSDPEGKKFVLPERGAEFDKKRIAKARRKSLALKPWVFVKWGEDLLDDSQSMKDENEELDTLIKNYEATIVEAETAKSPTVDLTLASPPNMPRHASKAFEPGKIPENYAFKEFFLKASDKVNVLKALPDDVSVRIKDNQLWIVKNHDLICETGGKGFQFELEGPEINWSGKGKKIACYRDGKLVCVYDPNNVEYRLANEGEAPATIELPPVNQAMPIAEAKIRHLFMVKQREANLKRTDKLHAKGLELQNQALSGLRTYVDSYKKDLEYAPMSLLQMAKIYVNQEKFTEATNALSELQQRYPKSAAAQQAPIYYFRTIMDALKKEKDDEKRKALQAKANSQAQSIKQSISTLGVGNLKLLAFRLFDKDEFGEDTNMSPELTVAALDEVMKRAESDESLQKLRERALYMKGLALYIKKDYKNADLQLVNLLAENDKTAYLFKCMLLRCKTLRKQKKIGESMDVVNKVIRKTSSSKERFKEEYWTGVLEMCRTLLTKKEDGARSAKLWLGQCIALDAKDKDLQWVREAAYYELVRAYFILNENKQAEKYRSEYRLSYPGGPWVRAINELN